MAETDRPHGEQGATRRGPPPADDSQGRDALDRLGRELDAAAARSGTGSASSEEAGAGRSRAVGKAYSLAIEMVAAVGVSVFIGWWLDRWLGTKPWLLLVFILLGIAAAMWSAIRTGLSMQARQQAEAAADAARKDKGG